jgi:hypothetical protein
MNLRFSEVKIIQTSKPWGYVTHAASSILNWLDDEWAPFYPTNKKPHECGD